MLIGLDIGSKRVGVAISDPAEKLARPLVTLARGQGRAEDAILKLIRKEGVRLIVAGLPLSGRNEETTQSRQCRQFCRRLERRLEGIAVTYVDEYLSSREAEEHLRRTGRPASGERKGVVDALSAAIILQGYLDRP